MPKIYKNIYKTWNYTWCGRKFKVYLRVFERKSNYDFQFEIKIKGRIVDFLSKFRNNPRYKMPKSFELGRKIEFKGGKKYVVRYTGDSKIVLGTSGSNETLLDYNIFQTEHNYNKVAIESHSDRDIIENIAYAVEEVFINECFYNFCYFDSEKKLGAPLFILLFNKLA